MKPNPTFHPPSVPSGLLLVVCFMLAPDSSILGATQPEPKFQAQTIDDQIQIGYGLAIADVNGDGQSDVLLADKNEIVWYENPSWSKHVIAENLTPRDHVCIAATDIDGDGKAEVAVGAEWNPGDTQDSGAVIYLAPPEDRTQKWRPVRLEHEPTTHRMHWALDWRNNWRLTVLPLHGRGNRGGQGEGVRFLSYAVPPNPDRDPGSDWSTRVLNDAFHMTHNFDPVFWDDDSAHEFLVAAREGTFLINWVDGGFAAQAIGGTERGGAGEVRLGRLPNGRRAVATIEPMHGSYFVVYREKPTNGASDSMTWEATVVTDSLASGHAIAAGDLLGAGHDQYAVGWRGNRDTDRVGIKLFSPANASGTEWHEHWIDENSMACEDLKLADLNGDGKLDVIAAGRRTKNVVVYWNR